MLGDNDLPADSHRFSGDLENAKDYLSNLHADSSNKFQFQYESKGVKVSSFALPGCSLPVLRGEMLMDAPAEDIAAIFECSGLRQYCTVFTNRGG